MGLLNYALLGVVLLVISKFMCDIGLNRVVYDHTPGVCREIFGVGDKGSEDIVVLRNSPHALISQGIHFPLMTLVNGEASVRDGEIFLYSLDGNPENRASPLTIVASKNWNRTDFHPSGLSVFEGTQPDDKPVVFAVNTKLHTVEVFELAIGESKLTHLKTIKDPLFRLVNNLVATGKDSFYLTNYLYSRHGALVFAEMLVPFVPFGSVLHYNGTAATQVIGNLRGPNGVAMSRDGRYLYVALNLARTLQVYEIGKPTELKLVGNVPLYSAPDNLNVDDDGNLWTGSQPIMYEAFLNLMDVEKHPRVAAQVLKITLKGGRFVEKVEEVFADSGAMLRLTSTAAAKAKRLLIGTVTHKAMSCELP